MTHDGRQNALRGVKLFVLDMDGTFYLGDQIIDGAKRFLETAERLHRDVLFFTNNSSRTSETYRQKLAGMDCVIDRNRILTSGDVAISYLQTHYEGAGVYLLGTQALRESFLEGGIRLVEHEQPDVVIAAFDTELTYHKLERACTYLRNGAVFLATHPDINCPILDNFIPDCGSFCAAITKSTGAIPRFLGKPSPETVEMILAKTGYRRQEIAFVGDRLYTDVATGVQNGARGFLVLSGETKRSEIAHSPTKPTAVFEHLGEIADALDRLDCECPVPKQRWKFALDLWLRPMPEAQRQIDFLY